MKKVLIALSLGIAGLSNAADITIELAQPTQKANVLMISGTIIKGDYEKFINATTKITNDKQVVVLLSGPGGALTEAMDIGLEINKRRFTTAAYGSCASACAYIWLAGDRAIVDLDSNAKVGFHAPYYVDKFGNKKSDNTASALLGGYLKEIGASYSIIAYTTSVDGASIRWLTESKAKEIGLSVEFYKTQINNQPQPETNKSPTIQLAHAEIDKTQDYNKTFNLQLAQLASTGRLGGPDYVRIQNAITQNNQWIKQQWDIINRLQSK